MKRTLTVFENHFWEFFNALPNEAQMKFEYILEIVISTPKVPRKFFKHVNEGIFEIRLASRGNSYRVFCFFENDNMVVLLNGFTKKTQKIPRNQIHKAKKLRKKYFNE